MMWYTSSFKLILVFLHTSWSFQSKWIMVLYVHFIVQNCVATFRCFLQRNQGFAPCFKMCIYLMKASLDCRLWLLPFSCKVLSWLEFVKVFFLLTEIIVSWCTILYCVLSGHLVLLSWSMHSFFLWLHQIVDLATPNVFAMSMIGLFCHFNVMMAESHSLWNFLRVPALHTWNQPVSYYLLRMSWNKEKTGFILP